MSETAKDVNAASSRKVTPEAEEKAGMYGIAKEL